MLTTWWFIYQRRKVICLMSSPSVHNTIVITIVTIVDNRWLLRQLFLFVPLSCLLPHRLSVSPTFSAEKTFSPSLSRHTVFSTTLSPLAQMRALVGAFIFPALSIPVPFDRSHFETRPPCKIKHPSNFHFCKSDDIIKMYQTGLFIIIFSTKKWTIKENKWTEKIFSLKPFAAGNATKVLFHVTVMSLDTIGKSFTDNDDDGDDDGYISRRQRQESLRVIGLSAAAP